MKANETLSLSPSVAAAEQQCSVEAPYGIIARIRAMTSDSIVRKGMLSVFDQGIVSGTSFVTSVLIGRLCTQGELGIYYLALTVFLFARSVQDQIIAAPYTIYCNQFEGDRLAVYRGSSFVHQFVFCFFMVIGLAVLSCLTSFGYGPSGLSTTSWMLVAMVPFLLFREHLRQFAFSRMALGTAIRLDLFTAALQIISLGTISYLGLLSIPIVFLIMGISCAIAAFGWFFLQKQPLRVSRQQLLPDWLKNWTFSKWALASHLVGTSTPYIMPWFVAAAQGNAATGVMAACSTIVGLGNSFVMGISHYLTPKTAHAYAHGGVPELCQVLRKIVLLFGVTVGSFCVLLFFAGDFIAILVYGETYANLGLLITIFGLVLLAGSFAMTAGNGLWAMDKPSANFRADVVSLITTLITAIILIPPYGVLGAAISTLIGTVADAVVRWWALRKIIQEKQAE